LKLFGNEVVETDAEAHATVIDTFLTEYEDFESKSGKFGGCDYIWNSLDLHKGNSHLWHKKYSVSYTEHFGRFVCCVCSRILGIGSAEHNWE